MTASPVLPCTARVGVWSPHRHPTATTRPPTRLRDGTRTHDPLSTATATLVTAFADTHSTQYQRESPNNSLISLCRRQNPRTTTKQKKVERFGRTLSRAPDKSPISTMKFTSAVLALGFYAPVAKACLAGPFTFQFEGASSLCQIDRSPAS